MMQIEQVEYSPFIFEKLKTAMGGYEAFYLQEVKNNTAQLWEINQGDSYAITRIELDEVRGPEMVLCCYEGRDLVPFVEQLKDAVKVLGLNGIRCHCSRPGFKRLAKQLAFNEIEQVYYHGISKH